MRAKRLSRRVLLLAACTAPALAQSMPDAVRAALGEARGPNEAKLTYFGFDVYDARLWVGTDFKRSAWEQYACALELTYLRAFKASAIVQRSLEEMQAQAPLSEAQTLAFGAWLRDAIPDVAKGDRLLGLYRVSGLEIWHNGVLKRSSSDAALASRFMGIWLSPKTSQPRLRDSLLKGLP